MSGRRVAIVAAAFVVLLLSPSAFAQSKHTTLQNGSAVLIDCGKDASGNPVSGQPLVEPVVLSADASAQLTVNLDIRQFTRNVPVLAVNKTTKAIDCVMTPFNLRMYGLDAANYTFPAPTLVLNKPIMESDDKIRMSGERLTVNLTNNLPLSDEQCTQKGNSQCPKELCQGNAQPQCCHAENLQLPNCFHGNNTTNLHFHGTHVSPQSPQDFVLLELQPAGTPAGSHPAHSPLGTTAIGSFQYALNPIPPHQPEGTHWYHPHKHGSTALQVGNGMAGALLIKGDFDAELQGYFGGKLTEHVMVVQQVHDLNFIQVPPQPLNPIPLINGQLQPVVKMRAGEIQRWRFINANQEGSAQITIDFNSPSNTGLTAMQVAQDGVRFSPTNYACQPLLDPTQRKPPCTVQPIANPIFNLSPGNRADFLVQAPASPGRYAVTYEVFGAVDRQGDRQLQRTRAGRGQRQPTVADVKQALEVLAPGAAQPAFLLIDVAACSDSSQCPTMKFPSTLTPMPSWLQNIPEKTDGVQEVQFRLDKTPGQPGGQGAQPQLFGIAVKNQNNGQTQQFDASCANFTQPLGRTETWTISQNLNNKGKPFHVFHIHINAFQVVRFGTQTYPEPIWMDSITLPDNPGAPADGFPSDPGSSVMIRQQFDDYTGPYVLHCHFLGHEDRGMMMMVQTVCPNASTNMYGIPQTTGLADDCTTCLQNPSKCQAALPPCAAQTLQQPALRQQPHSHRERRKKH